MKNLNLPKLSKEAILNGATKFLIPCKCIESRTPFFTDLKIIELFSPYQVGNGVYFEVAAMPMHGQALVC